LARSTSTSLALVLTSGLALVAALSSTVDSRAQDGGSLCPASGFDICFPNLSAGAPAAACSATEEDAADISACFASVCSPTAVEPEPGFFSYCCAAGGSVKYDDFCVFVVQTACPTVATHCADRCPPLALLTGTVPLAPPPAACLPDYPAAISAVCQSDPFCCTTSWDEICATAALAAGVVPADPVTPAALPVTPAVISPTVPASPVASASAAP
jgi:hypothetical protein